jgi:hypothetical protein
MGWQDHQLLKKEVHGEALNGWNRGIYDQLLTKTSNII